MTRIKDMSSEQLDAIAFDAPQAVEELKTEIRSLERELEAKRDELSSLITAAQAAQTELTRRWNEEQRR